MPGFSLSGGICLCWMFTFEWIEIPVLRLGIVSKAGSRNWQNYRSGSGCLYQHSEMESVFAACAQRLCATIEKPVNMKGRYYDVCAFWILSFEKASVIHFGVRSTFVCVRFNKETISLVIEFDVIYREHYSIMRKDVHPFSVSSILKT